MKLNPYTPIRGIDLAPLGGAVRYFTFESRYSWSPNRLQHIRATWLHSGEGTQQRIVTKWARNGEIP